MLNLPEHVCLFLVDLVSFLSICGVYLALKSSTSLPVYSTQFVKGDAAYMVGEIKMKNSYCLFTVDVIVFPKRLKLSNFLDLS